MESDPTIIDDAYKDSLVSNSLNALLQTRTYSTLKNKEDIWRKTENLTIGDPW